MVWEVHVWQNLSWNIWKFSKTTNMHNITIHNLPEPSGTARHYTTKFWKEFLEQGVLPCTCHPLIFSSHSATLTVETENGWSVQTCFPLWSQEIRLVRCIIQIHVKNGTGVRCPALFFIQCGAASVEHELRHRGHFKSRKFSPRMKLKTTWCNIWDQRGTRCIHWSVSNPWR